MGDRDAFTFVSGCDVQRIKKTKRATQVLRVTDGSLVDGETLVANAFDISVCMRGQS